MSSIADLGENPKVVLRKKKKSVKLAQEVLNMMKDEHLSLMTQDNLRNPLTFIGGFLKRYRKKHPIGDVLIPQDVVDNMIDAIMRAEMALKKDVA